MGEENNIPERISYSALSNFNHCPRYFQLVNVKKLKQRGSPQTTFGTLIHRHVQEALELPPELIPKSVDTFNKTWKRFCSFYKLEEKYTKLAPVGEKAIYYINGFLKSHYGTFKVKHIEYKIEHKVLDFPQNFKGFIDLVLELENGRIVIADIKTANSTYYFNKYKDNFKEYQLSFYKKFYSEIESIDRDKIETCFIVIEKDLNSKKPLTIIEVSSGDKKLQNAQNWLTNSLKAINSNKYNKNLLSCRKFGEGNPCPFLGTEYCKKI